MADEQGLVAQLLALKDEETGNYLYAKNDYVVQLIEPYEARRIAAEGALVAAHVRVKVLETALQNITLASTRTHILQIATHALASRGGCENTR